MVRTHDRSTLCLLFLSTSFLRSTLYTIDSDESLPSLSLQSRRPRRNRSPTLIAVVYLPHEPPNSTDHPPNSPVEPANSSYSQDRPSPRPNIHAHQPIQPGPSRRTPRPSNDGAEPHSTQRRTRGHQQPPLAGSSISTADDDENHENETEHHDTKYHSRERGQFRQGR
ncbi:hypothetical protein GOBAR_DD13528 [Gossypium barbadense]|nr:hypothetical protein GOBAR_DD13528 [Gossypium barbadense]